MQERLYWIDWMKVLGMYLIIVGHTFPTGNEYIYSFNVPVFFLISGYLNNERGGIIKIVKNLIVPMIIICVVNLIPIIITWIDENQFSMMRILGYLFNCFIGKQGQLEFDGGLGICWFIYSLALMKIAHLYIQQKEVLLILACAVAIVLHHYNYTLYSAVADAATCYPFFYIGYSFKKIQVDYRLSVKSPYSGRHFIILLFSIIAVMEITNSNGAPWCFKNGYGAHFVLYIIGGLAGSYVLYFFSKVLGKWFSPNVLVVLSNGMIVILGFHPFFISVIPIISRYLIGEFGDWEKYIASVVILLFFYPIILFVKKYFPILMGTREIVIK